MECKTTEECSLLECELDGRVVDAALVKKQRGEQLKFRVRRCGLGDETALSAVGQSDFS
jgi:hypothetical protein